MWKLRFIFLHQLQSFRSIFSVHLNNHAESNFRIYIEMSCDAFEHLQVDIQWILYAWHAYCAVFGMDEQSNLRDVSIMFYGLNEIYANNEHMLLPWQFPPYFRVIIHFFYAWFSYNNIFSVWNVALHWIQLR